MLDSIVTYASPTFYDDTNPVNSNSPAAPVDPYATQDTFPVTADGNIDYSSSVEEVEELLDYSDSVGNDYVDSGEVVVKEAQPR